MLEDWYFSLNAMKKQGLDKGKQKGRKLPPECSIESLKEHFQEEITEVYESWCNADKRVTPFAIAHFLRELSDLSNMVDLTFETYYFICHNSLHSTKKGDGK